MNHRPVCVKCQVELTPEKNGVGLLDMASFGPYKIWEADLWKCPVCNYEIVVGFGRDAIAEHYDETSFQGHIEWYQDHSLLIKSWENPKTKAEAQ